MGQLKDLSEFNNTLVTNFRLKAKILFIMFGCVLFFQLCAISYLALKTNVIGTIIPDRMAIIGPLLLITGFVSEGFAFFYMRRVQERGGQLKSSLTYFVTFIEVSFPCSVIFMAGSFMSSSSVYPVMQVMNSPLFILIFIMIILSSLMLNPLLSLFAGAIGAGEYFILNLFFIPLLPNTTFVDYVNAGVKSAFILVSGLLCGFVSKKIREAIISSLESKNELIHNLDKRVAEKTQQVVAQNTEIEKKNVLLEEKQKEILDSIHYAKRIQTTLLPSEQYIARHLTKK